jgi:hypothetical protein
MFSERICGEDAGIECRSAIDKARLEGKSEHGIDVRDWNLPNFLLQVGDKRTPVIDTDPKDLTVVDFGYLEEVSVRIKNVVSIAVRFEHLKLGE